MILLNLILVLHFLSTSAALTYTSIPAPKLECGRDSIRLQIHPSAPFGGHVYVRGFFPQSVCHLNYCTNFTNSPITMELPFRGPCNIRRRRNTDPPSIIYEVTVIIQHHPLFVTTFDKAYRLNCVYRQHDAMVQQKLNVSDINPTPLQSNSAPQCRYDVVAGTLNGPIVKFANVGDIVVHKWSCSNDHFGFVVHSCVVRDVSGANYQFVDERGCVTDSSLFPQITYSDDLSSAFTSVRAFRYADQIMVHFTCQITTCRKYEQGCEGITPPTCHPLDLGPIRVQYTKNKEKEIKSDNVINTLPTRAQKSTTTTTSMPQTSRTEENNLMRSTSSKFEDAYQFPNPAPSGESDNSAELDVGPEYGLEIVKGNAEKLKSAGFHVETLSQNADHELQLEPLPFPTKAAIFHQRTPRSHKGVAEAQNITLEVESAQFLVLENDEEFRPNEPKKSEEAQNCLQVRDIGGTFLIITLIITQVISIMAIITQRIYYKKSIDKLTYLENEDDRISTRKY